jgi:hypothetical protein
MCLAETTCACIMRSHQVCMYERERERRGMHVCEIEREKRYACMRARERDEVCMFNEVTSLVGM